MRNLEAAKLSDSKGFRKYSARGSEERKIPVLLLRYFSILHAGLEFPRDLYENTDDCVLSQVKSSAQS